MTNQAPRSKYDQPRAPSAEVPRGRPSNAPRAADQRATTLAARCLTLPATRPARCVTRQQLDSRTIGLFVTLVYPLGETPCVRRTTFLPSDTTAEMSGSRRSCGIFVICPLALSAGAENYAKPVAPEFSHQSCGIFLIGSLFFSAVQSPQVKSEGIVRLVLPTVGLP
jgi:hypothetical protein